MSLTPNDIRNFTFPSALRGYDKDAVDAFIEQVAQAMEATKQIEMKLGMELESVKAQLSGLKQFEDTIKNAAIDSRRNADSLVAGAKQEASLLIAKAKGEAEQLIATRSSRIAEVESQLKRMEQTRTTYLNKLRQLISQHLDMINEVSGAEPQQQQQHRVQPQEKLEITGSTELTRSNLETIATPPSREKAVREEANATDGTIVGKVASSDDAMQFTGSLKAVMQTETPAEQTQSAPEPVAPVDPELAAALERYQKLVRERSGAVTQPVTGETMIGSRQNPSATGAVPTGFVTSETNQSVDDSTDRVQLQRKQASQANEHNSLNLDTPIVPEASHSGTKGINIAQELDAVVAKFEEEMDKAAKSKS